MGVSGSNLRYIHVNKSRDGKRILGFELRIRKLTPWGGQWRERFTVSDYDDEEFAKAAAIAERDKLLKLFAHDVEIH